MRLKKKKLIGEGWVHMVIFLISFVELLPTTTIKLNTLKNVGTMRFFYF